MRYRFLIVFLFVVITCRAGGYLYFLNTPITGSMKEFVGKLKAKGLEHVDNKGWFKGFKTAYLRGDFWQFPDCDIVVRQPKKHQNVTSVYIHPHSNFLLLNDMLEVLDSKYGAHATLISNFDVNSVNYVWQMPEGNIVAENG